MLDKQITNHSKFRTTDRSRCLSELYTQELGTVIFRESNSFPGSLILIVVVNKRENIYSHTNPKLGIMEVIIREDELKILIDNSANLNKNLLDLMEDICNSKLEQSAKLFKGLDDLGTKYMDLAAVSAQFSSSEDYSQRYTKL